MAVKKISHVNIYLWMMIGSAAGLTVASVFIAVSIFAPKVFAPHTEIFTLIFTSIASIFGSGTAFSLKAFLDQRRFISQLRLENTYALGVEASFYNLDAFKNRVHSLRATKSRAKKRQYIIAFTPTSALVAGSGLRNKEMTKFNQKIAGFLTALFEQENNEFLQKNSVYAFSRGAFLIYLFVNDVTLVHRLIEVISNGLFKIVADEHLKVWCQPFFGVKELQAYTPLTSSIEDALIARSISESNYESLTFFNEKAHKDVTQSDASDIVKALDNNEFVPYYQPKFSLKEKKFISAEVLARWHSPTNGLLTPDKFIAKAEAAGLLSNIDIAIFKAAVKEIGDNLKRGRRVLPISCNFSLYEFFSRNFLETIINTLKDNQVPFTYVEIEITETTSQINKFLSLSVIKKLKDLGVRVLMDDFGVGYSQINSLRQIPFDAIKIDKSLTDHVIDDEKTKNIIKFLVELGHDNDMEVIVEGVETEEQIELLKKLRVDTIQGFYYSKAISFQEYNELLKANKFEKRSRK